MTLKPVVQGGHRGNGHQRCRSGSHLKHPGHRLLTRKTTDEPGRVIQLSPLLVEGKIKRGISMGRLAVPARRTTGLRVRPGFPGLIFYADRRPSVVYTSLAATCHKSTSISRGARLSVHSSFFHPETADVSSTLLAPYPVAPPSWALLCVILTASCRHKRLRPRWLRIFSGSSVRYCCLLFQMFFEALRNEANTISIMVR